MLRLVGKKKTEIERDAKKKRKLVRNLEVEGGRVKSFSGKLLVKAFSTIHECICNII